MLMIGMALFFLQEMSISCGFPLCGCGRFQDGLQRKSG
jgi:hypothetical protein